MSYALQYQPDPKKNVVGIAVVVLLHVVVVYALVSGLARKVVDVVRSPIETKVIEEIKETPPPKEIILPPPVLTTPPPFIPPPEVTISTPPPAPTIAAVTPTPPPEEAFKPTPAPVVAAAAPPVAKPAAVSISLACPTRPLPKLSARQEGVAGSVLVRLTIKDGKVINTEFLKSVPRGFFDAAVRAAVAQYVCQTTGEQTVVAEQPFVFTAE